MVVMTIQSIIDGLLIGGVYSTIAVGLSLAFGVMRIVNWAQGELLMVSMYISYFIFNWLGLDPYLIMFFTAAIMFVVGFFLQDPGERNGGGTDFRPAVHRRLGHRHFQRSAGLHRPAVPLRDDPVHRQVDEDP